MEIGGVQTPVYLFVYFSLTLEPLFIYF